MNVRRTPWRCSLDGDACVGWTNPGEASLTADHFGDVGLDVSELFRIVFSLDSIDRPRIVDEILLALVVVRDARRGFVGIALACIARTLLVMIVVTMFTVVTIVCFGQIHGPIFLENGWLLLRGRLSESVMQTRRVAAHEAFAFVVGFDVGREVLNTVRLRTENGDGVDVASRMNVDHGYGRMTESDAIAGRHC